MSSGIAVEDSCFERYQELKERQYRYVIFKVRDDLKGIVVEKVGSRTAPWDEFVDAFPEKDCRYAVYDLEYEMAPGEGLRSRICFVLWSPMVAPIRKRLIYAYSKEAIAKSLQGVAANIEAADLSDLDQATVVGRFTRGK
ncbi:actin depolymerization factor/cofilin-like domain-containing protein [Streptomyces sp. MZ04]|uniref:actin-binding ADF family protein n=1 Tax=Streptomyces sp. MZ04 TaxID=2559236 RepID=UPI001432E254|nr:actin depolymerization factor/cofilin-like domain-containing protein [Streptomyces sp. MZ04]